MPLRHFAGLEGSDSAVAIRTARPNVLPVNDWLQFVLMSVSFDVASHVAKRENLLPGYFKNVG
jgi:hypothetical protein